MDLNPQEEHSTDDERNNSAMECETFNFDVTNDQDNDSRLDRANLADAIGPQGTEMIKDPDEAESNHIMQSC